MNKQSKITIVSLIFLISISIIFLYFVYAGGIEEINEIINKFNSGTTLELSKAPTLSISQSSIESDIDFTITEISKGKFRVDWAWKKDGDIISIKNNLTNCLTDGKTLASKCSTNLITSANSIPLEKTREETYFDELESKNVTSLVTYVNPIYINPKDVETCKVTIVNNLTCDYDLKIDKNYAICSRLNKFNETTCEPLLDEFEEPICTTKELEETIIVFERDFETFDKNTIFWNTYNYNSTCNLIELKKAIPNYIMNLSNLPVKNSNVLINSTFDFRNDSGSFTFDVPYSSLFGEYKISGKLFDLGFGTATFTLNNQGDNIWTNNNTPAFNFTLKGSNLSYDVQLFINNTGYGVVNALNNTPTVITTNASLPDGTYAWYLNATNGTTDMSAIRNITIDTGIPTLNVTSPINSSYYNSSSVLFNVSSSEEATGSIIPDIDNSLVSWWRMDDTNGSANSVVDYTGRNNGTAQGNASQVDNGKLGKGFAFDGNGDYVKILSPKTSAKMTISLWFKEALNATTNSLVGRFNGVSYLSENNLWTTGSGAIAIQWYNSSNSLKSTLTSSGRVTINNWYHLGITMEDGVQNIYLNGLLVTNDSDSGNMLTGTSAMTIGQAYSLLDFNGTIDDVMIFNRSLSSDEILSIYNATKYQHTEALAEGSHTFKAYTQDLAGNMANSSLINFNTDTSIPTLNVSSPVNSSYYNSSSVLFNVSSSEEGTGSIIPDIDNSLVSWWRMDDVNSSGDVVDYTGRNNGTAQGGAVQTDAGKLGKGMSFDGNSFINIISLNWSTSSYWAQLSGIWKHIAYNGTSTFVDGVAQCPDGMAYINKLGGYCIDKYEVSTGGCEIVGNNCASAQTDYCTACTPDAGVFGSSSSSTGTTALAYSKPNVAPLVRVSQLQARQMCVNAGKHLCTDEEWMGASNILGKVYNLPTDLAVAPYRCITGSSTYCNYAGNSNKACNTTLWSGGNSNCASAEGVYDMVGNVWEWTNETVYYTKPCNTAVTGYCYINATSGDWQTSSTSPVYGNDGVYFTANTTTNKAVRRGGYWDDGASAGPFCAVLDNAPSDVGSSRGFRCCSVQT